jgi:hypothetical protein
MEALFLSFQESGLRWSKEFVKNVKPSKSAFYSNFTMLHSGP